MTRRTRKTRIVSHLSESQISAEDAEDTEGRWCCYIRLPVLAAIDRSVYTAGTLTPGKYGSFPNTALRVLRDSEQKKKAGTQNGYLPI
ncbi:hypothetical protein C6502_00165 [Candidatus Poribacteria bacterium]|nr:MAG: hypothetical protein C6502_00165 [Candidatus Poribacteria bacterium]